MSHLLTLRVLVMAMTLGIGITRPSRAQDLATLTGENELPLQITGFAVGAYSFDGRSRDQSFEAGKMAVALFRELNTNVWFFGQLTTALESAEAGAEEGDVVTETEIDNLLINLTMPGASNVSLSFGKFDVPIGFERDDEPLNLQSSTSFNFTFARPAKMVGLVGRWTINPHVDVTGVVSNGWESQIDPNHNKTGLVRIGLLPTDNSSLGLSATYGNEGPLGETAGRYLVTMDYAFQPVPSLIVAGEGNYGGDRGVLTDGSDARWLGGTVTVFGRISRRVGLTVRGEGFKDRDGVRTGVAQTLSSFTVAPVYFLGVGRDGIFANVEHTTFRIPRFQLRGEVRYDHSTQPFFPSEDGLDTWGIRYGIQLVTTF